MIKMVMMRIVRIQIKILIILMMIIILLIMIVNMIIIIVMMMMMTSTPPSAHLGYFRCQSGAGDREK